MISNRNIIIVNIGTSNLNSTRSAELIADIKEQFLALYDRVVFIEQKHDSGITVEVIPLELN